MKRRWKMAALSAALLLAFTACAEKETDSTAEEKSVTDSQEAETAPEKPEADPEEDKTEAETNPEEDKTEADPDAGDEAAAEEKPADEAVEIEVYFANDDVSALEKEKVKLGALTAEEVWKQLVLKGVVPADTKVQSLKEVENDGEKALHLDLSEKFAVYLNGQGSAGEYLTVGSICNTFLDAFDREAIRITVMGKELSTGHAEYPGYMTKYEAE